MYAIDFEYDGIRLSDYGCIICSFGSKGMETLSSGADITFNTVNTAGSDRFRFYGSRYDDYYSSTFQICHNPNNKNNPAEMFLSPIELSAIQRWLCRKDNYHRFSLVQDNMEDIFWNAVFSSRQIQLNGSIIGLELTMYTDAPYAYRMIGDISYEINPGMSVSVYDVSDEIGFIYPVTTIKCMASGNITLQNSMDKKVLQLYKVSNGEILTLNGEHKIISSSLDRNDLANNFNYYFPRIINTYESRENVYTLSADSVPCQITFRYSPIVKAGL